MFSFSDTLGPVDVAFTDRAGGVSDPPYESLNLAAVGGDDPGAVAENLRRVMAAFTGAVDAPAAAMHQVHGCRVAVVGGDAHAGPLGTGHAGLPEADGLATAERGVTLVVRVADCLPVLLADPGAAVVAALHVGRVGLAAGIVPAGVAAARRLGGRRLVAWLGPRVCGGCYEVPEPMRAEVVAAVPESWAQTRGGTPAVDVAAGAAAQLRHDGVEVVDTGRCTREDPALYSFRRDGQRAGRLAGLVRVRP